MEGIPWERGRGEENLTRITFTLYTQVYTYKYNHEYIHIILLQVSGYIYVRRRTRVNQSVVDYARTKCISIVREGEVDADELAELVDRNLKI